MAYDTHIFRWHYLLQTSFQAQVAQYLSFAGVSAQGEQSVMGGEASSSMEHSLYVLYSVSAVTGYANRVMGKQEFGYARTP